MNVLLLHPGAMGASIGAALVGGGHRASWVGDGRSVETVKRADDAGLLRVGTLAAGIAEADVVVSVCPPHAAVDVARSVAVAGFAGIYVDGNAVSPATAETVYGLFGARYVDGGIIGPPAWREGATRFYLSGEHALEVAAMFDGSLVDARAIGPGPAQASALKMAYAAFTKGSSALLLAIRALAQRNGVANELLAEWDISQPGLRNRSAGTAKSTSLKAWRFEGEMREIAATFAQADLPSGFHQAAAEVYARMATLKDTPGGAEIDVVLREILGERNRG